MKTLPALSIPVLTFGFTLGMPTEALLAAPRNVLFITVDDFRPELPAYGATHIQAPNMDRLSDGGLTFNRAYVQQAICQPARVCVLTGARPDTTRIYDVFESGTPTFRTTMGSVATLPSVFKDNGYWTAGYGKNFHHTDNPSWNESNTFYTTQDLYKNPVNRAIASDPNNRPPVENYAAGVEADYMDAKVAAAAAAAIRARAADNQPFFIAAGFWKPHLPFTAPKAYWDLYDRNTIPIATGPDALPTQGGLTPQFYDPYSGELGTYKGGKPPFVAITPTTQAALNNGTFTTNQQTGADYGIITVNGTHIYPEDYVRELTHGYYACTSFVDAQIGKLLAALEDPNNDGNTADSILDDTIVVLWGDHGFQLGKHGSWPKHTNMDISTRMPFIIHHPDMPAGTKGQMTDALMESVDIMPTLLEMMNLPVPGTHTLEGRSLVPLLANPDRAWKTAAFSQYPKEVPAGSGNWFMGYAMRTPTHTYMQWREMVATDANPISLASRNFTISNTVAQEELYDMVNDPNQRQNIGADPKCAALLDALGKQLNTALSTGCANTQNVGVSAAAAPQAQAVAFTGSTGVGSTLTAHYLYADANGDNESGSTLEWVRADSFAGPYASVVGTGSAYTLQAADAGKYVKLRVTPATAAAPTAGATTLSDLAVVAGTGYDDGSTQPAPESAIYEGFDYAAGTLSSSSAGGRGWAGGWWGNDALSFGANSGSSAADLTWSNLPGGYHLTPTGRAATNGANANNPFRQFTSGQTIDLAQNGTRYFSFLYRHNGSAATFEQRFHAGTAQTFKLQISASGSLALITADETKMALLSLAANTDYLVLGRIQSAATGNDTLAVSIYKAGDTVPADPPVFAASVNLASNAVIDRMFFGNPVNSANLGNSYWDEFHIDSTYTAVVGSASAGGDELVPPTVVETFTYNAGGLNSSNAGGSGWDGGWFGDAALTFSANSGAAAADKAWSVPTGYTYSPVGRAATNSTNGNTPFRKLGSGSTIDLAAETTYFSFLFRHDSSVMFECRFYAGTTEITKLQVDTTGQLRLNGATFVPTGFNLTAGQDYLLVGKITGNVSGNDSLQVSAFPASGSVPDTEPSFSYSVNFSSSSVIDRMMLGIAGSTASIATFWDELRLGTTWRSVLGAVPAPLPAATSLSVTGTSEVGGTLTANYTFTYTNGSEGTSTYKWYRADTEGGAYAAIAGATSSTYTPTTADSGKWLRFGVTPIAQDSVAGPEVFSSPQAIAAASSEPTPILHLAFDSATLADSSPANLTVTGTPTFESADGRSYAVFNGTSNSITVPMLRSFPAGLSVCFWTRAQDGTNGMPKNTALGWARQNGGDGTVIAPGYNNTNKHIFRMGRTTINDEVSIGAPLTNYLNTWVHWVIIKDPAAGTMKLYRDGIEVGSSTGKTIVPEFVSDSNTGGASGGFRIGRFWSEYYKGHLDDYRIYDAALTPAQVQTIYQSSAATEPTAFNLAVSGTPAQVGSALTASYQYAGGTQGTSEYQWFRSVLEAGPWVEISGANALAFTPTTAEDGGYVRFRVIPKNDAGVSGDAVWSSPILIGTFVNRSLANTVRRIQNDHALNVVFLGGSITDGVGQNNGLSYRTRVMNWMQSAYPAAAFTFTNSAISGSGSEFGVFRTDRHVLAHNPDLVFVEFAVNDSDQEQVNWTYIYRDDRIRAAMDGIVRKIRAAAPACDIVFLYTTTVAMATTYYEQGQLPPKVLVHKEVAEHYGIPQISLGQALVAHKQQTGYPYRIAYGEPGAFSPTANHYLPDYVHPSNLGHQVYGDAVQSALTGLFNIATPTVLANHPVPAPLSPVDLTTARILDRTNPAVTFGAGWTPATLSIGTTRTEEFQTTASASTVGMASVSFSGNEFGVYYRRSSTSGQIAWSSGSASGEKSFNDPAFSGTGFTSYAMLSTALGTGTHAATITPQAIDASENLAIAGWLVLGEAPLRTPGPIRIMALGDSITYGLSFGEANGQTAFPCGYRGPLQNLLQADPNFTNNFEFVGLEKSTNTNTLGTFDKSKATTDLLRYDGNHQGHPSYTIQNNYTGNSTPPPGNIYTVLTTNYTAETFDPDIVLLHIGINDIIAQEATAESIQDDYRALLSKIYELQPGVDLYISTIMINHPNHPNYAQLTAFNTYLRDVELPHWQSQGKSIHLVDIFAALQDSGYSSTLPSTNINYGTTASPTDRTHPNHTGYANMAAAWKAALTRPAHVSAPSVTLTLWADAEFALLAGGSSHPDADPTADPTADPDRDGIPNLLEFALGGHPTQSGAGILPVIGTSGDRLTLGFTPGATTGMRYTIEASSNLSDWSDMSDITGLLTPGQPYTHTDTADLGTGTPRRFLRLRVTVP